MQDLFDFQMVSGADMFIGKVITEQNRKRGEWYVRFGLTHEFLGRQKLSVNGTDFNEKLTGTGVYYGFGMDWLVSPNLRLYAGLERANGKHYTKDYDIRAGLKWLF